MNMSIGFVSWTQRTCPGQFIVKRDQKSYYLVPKISADGSFNIFTDMARTVPNLAQIGSIWEFQQDIHENSPETTVKT